MCYRIIPDRDEVIEKISIEKRKMIWGFASSYYPDIFVASIEAERLQRIWKIRWNVILDDADDIKSWAMALMKYRANGVFI